MLLVLGWIFNLSFFAKFKLIKVDSAPESKLALVAEPSSFMLMNVAV
jgi:hypothetical protein